MRLKAADIDQEVKERAISCMGQIICNLGDYLQVSREKLINLLIILCGYLILYLLRRAIVIVLG